MKPSERKKVAAAESVFQAVTFSDMCEPFGGDRRENGCACAFARVFLS